MLVVLLYGANILTVFSVFFFFFYTVSYVNKKKKKRGTTVQEQTRQPNFSRNSCNVYDVELDSYLSIFFSFFFLLLRSVHLIKISIRGKN